MSVPKVEGQHVLSKYFFFYIFDLWSIVKLRGVCRRSWDLLGPLGVLLGASWGGLGASWGLLGGSWGLLGRSKLGPKFDPKIDPKSSRIRDGPKYTGSTKIRVSEGSEPQRDLDPGRSQNYPTP